VSGGARSSGLDSPRTDSRRCRESHRPEPSRTFGARGFPASAVTTVMPTQCWTVFSHFPAKRALSRFEPFPIRHWDAPT
jgi:hypothetical protein